MGFTLNKKKEEQTEKQQRKIYRHLVIAKYSLKWCVVMTVDWAQ